MNIKSLKATRLGRAMARILGDENGAVMMEYVVLAVLLVAAVVGAVIAFSGRIQNQFKAAGEAAGGQTTTAEGTVGKANTTFKEKIGDAVTSGNKINGGEFQSGGNASGGK